MSHKWNGKLFVMLSGKSAYASLLSSKLSYKLKTWLHQTWFVVLAYSEICWSIPSSSCTPSCISMVYSDGAESGRKMRSNQNVHESWSYLKLHVDPTRACEPSYTLFGIENGSKGCVVERSEELVLAQSCIKTRIFMSMYSLSKTI